MFWIPSEDEWYKAAYYDGGKGLYYDYATGTNNEPSHDVVEPDPGNNANFAYKGGDFVVGHPYFTTEVGEYENSESPYGTFDQAGNVLEWTETTHSTDATIAKHCLRGGTFNFAGTFFLKPSTRNDHPPTEQSGCIGFRLATCGTQ